MLYIPAIIPEPDPADGLISRACMAKYLLGLMAGDFSESYLFVSWTDELPYLFWDAAQGLEVEGAFGPVTLPEEQRKLILELASVSGGWWASRPDQSEQGESFVGLDEWRDLHLKRIK